MRSPRRPGPPPAPCPAARWFSRRRGRARSERPSRLPRARAWREDRTWRGPTPQAQGRSESRTDVPETYSVKFYTRYRTVWNLKDLGRTPARYGPRVALAAATPG